MVTRPPTMRDVAVRAAVSAKTVSNVVTGRTPVSPVTRARVESALRELRYRPNVAARQLRVGSSPVIGLALPDLHSRQCSVFADAVVSVAADHGLIVLVHLTRGDPAQEDAILRSTAADLADGFILGTRDGHVQERWPGFAHGTLVVVGLRQPSTRLPESRTRPPRDGGPRRRELVRSAGDAVRALALSLRSRSSNDGGDGKNDA